MNAKLSAKLLDFVDVSDVQELTQEFNECDCYVDAVNVTIYEKVQLEPIMNGCYKLEFAPYVGHVDFRGKETNDHGERIDLFYRYGLLSDGTYNKLDIWFT